MRFTFYAPARRSGPEIRKGKSRPFAALHPLLIGLCLSCVYPLEVRAQNEDSSVALNALKQFVASETKNGRLQDATPIFVVLRAANKEIETPFTQNAIDALMESFSDDELRICLPCSNPRTLFRDDKIEHNSAFPSLPEVLRLDTQMRGSGPAARTALFVQDLGTEISVQAHSLAEGTLLVSEIFPRKKPTEHTATERLSLRSAVQQKARGWTLTHWFNDLIVYPSPHIAIDVVDQIGEQRNHLLGVSTSLWNPLLGIGVSYHYVLPNFWNATIGGKFLMSLPNLVLSGVLPDNPVGAVIDPTFTPMVVVRLPIPYSPLAISAMASMAVDFGAIRAPQVGIGISMLDFPPAVVLP